MALDDQYLDALLARNLPAPIPGRIRRGATRADAVALVARLGRPPVAVPQVVGRPPRGAAPAPSPAQAPSLPSWGSPTSLPSGMPVPGPHTLLSALAQMECVISALVRFLQAVGLPQMASHPGAGNVSTTLDVIEGAMGKALVIIHKGPRQRLDEAVEAACTLVQCLGLRVKYRDITHATKSVGWSARIWIAAPPLQGLSIGSLQRGPGQSTMAR
jgi:hypothetical protein